MLARVALHLHNPRVMRRAILAATLLAAPLLAAGQTNPTAGQVLPSKQPEDKYINAAQCIGAADTAPLNLIWQIQVKSGTFETRGRYQIFAATQGAYNTTGTNQGYCAESNDTTNGIQAGQIASLPADDAAVLTPQAFDPVTIVNAVGLQACTAQVKTIYICVHWYDSSGTRRGFAQGSVTLSTAKPATPVNVSVTPGENALNVNWENGTGGAERTEEYQVRATPAGTTDTVPSKRVTGTSLRLGGLTNGVTYDVQVVAYTESGNPSDPSATVSATPVPVSDFWEQYKARGGTDSGGCGAGGTGALAMIGAAALAALRRRKP
ncbi:Myxococcales GC_trans_RRR domain protein [Anaeromyxobacter dehalogenans 2CP-1]|uniref:Myxococcales GC_trans_RRR domain protein n=2 Tax=Anaeromyxobacter dehalogenans TaxID=161493 RepID=B8J6S1_ANAD2|nr:Myxococcales GC_trans_RRR domain protein [Anaeromyxobacter dehalogenans 2CP-1]